LLLLLGAVGCSAPERREAAVSVTVATTGKEHAVDITGVDRLALRKLERLAPNDTLWARMVAVYVERDGAETAAPSTPASRTPAVIGRYAANAGRLHFTPRFPFASGVAYRVDVDTSAMRRVADGDLNPTRESAAPLLVHRFSIPTEIRQRTTRVLAVHPSLPELPSNLLRWYLEFSSPMAPGTALSHVHLMDEAGREVTGAFLALDQELWDPDRRRLTLLFDPGRVKRGIRTNLESGAPLIAGRRYRLIIDDTWIDGAGAALASGYEHAFAVLAADRRSPEPERWRLTVPSAESRADLRVAFGEPLDHALAGRMLSVYDGRGVVIGGSARLADGDSTWTFSPAAAWTAGAYTLHVDAALEDVAGNSIARLFDVDRRASSAPPGEGPAVRTVPFSISR
jgi:hypothetical protein